MTVALRNGTTVGLRVVCPVIDIAVRESAAYHPVAELLSVATVITTARAV